MEHDPVVGGPGDAALDALMEGWAECVCARNAGVAVLNALLGRTSWLFFCPSLAGRKPLRERVASCRAWISDDVQVCSSVALG